MKVVIDARESGTGTGRYIDKLVEYLHELKPGFEVLVLTKSPRLDFMKGIAPGFEVVKSNYMEFTFAEQLGLVRQLRKLKPDLVHFGMTQQPVLYRGRKITTIHDLITARFDNPAKNPVTFKFKQQVYKRVIKQAAKTSERIIVPSEYVKKDVAQFSGISPSRITVTYEAADRITAKPESIPRLKDKRYIMYVGRATPHKNLARLVSAFTVLKKVYPDLMLALVGKTDANYRRLSALVSAKRMADSVVFTDHVSEGELRWLYEHTLAYVFPSLSEGFGLPALEAMAHGAPVVSSNATCLPEIYGDAAEYFDPKDTKDMARAIHQVIGNSKRAKRLGSAGLAQVKKYSWRRMAEQTLDVYDEILKNT